MKLHDDPALEAWRKRDTREIWRDVVVAIMCSFFGLVAVSLAMALAHAHDELRQMRDENAALRRRCE